MMISRSNEARSNGSMRTRRSGAYGRLAERQERNAAIKRDYEAGMTQQELADRHDLSRAAVSYIVKGRTSRGQAPVVDAEFLTITRLLEILSPLDDGARERIIGYVEARLRSEASAAEETVC